MNKFNSNYLGAVQIRAARAMLNWSQDGLAETCGLSVATIRKIEAGNISPRGKTITLIEQAFDNAGLEFIDPNGVRQRPDDITVYQGEEGTRDFIDDIYAVSLEKGGEIVQVWNSAYSIFELMPEYRAIHFARMQAIRERIVVKCILTENLIFTPAPYCQYRSLSKHYVNSVPFYVYGDKYAIILFKDLPSPKIIVIHSRLASDAFRFQFTSMWEK
jgi:transcriptional regulator with XRE-family HTH domain